MSRNKIQYGRPKKAKQTPSQFNITIDNLSLEGRGVARNKGKTVFVEGAIPGEMLTVKIEKQHKHYDEASIVAINTASEHRISPQCEHYNDCGGCQLQHIETDAQLNFKQQAVLSLLARGAKITPTKIDTPLSSSGFHYRRSARIGVNFITQTQTAIVGFRRSNSNQLLQVSNCMVLPEYLSGLFDQLRNTLENIENAKTITHVEYLQGDTTGALTFRAMSKLSTQTCAMLEKLLQNFKLQGFIRYDDQVVPLANNPGSLDYNVNQLSLSFKPGDFLQVNAAVNQQMISRAVQWLALNKKDRILDLFCGLGNFSLPIAQQVKSLTGVEGSTTMVERATANAAQNNLDNAQFFSADLSQDIQGKSWFTNSYNKLIIDPPRNGASEVISQLLTANEEGTSINPSHILYIACDPSSQVRDAKLLQTLGYQMDKFSVMDMFPNTTHIESMALFVKRTKRPKKSNTQKLFGH